MVYIERDRGPCEIYICRRKPRVTEYTIKKVYHIFDNLTRTTRRGPCKNASHFVKHLRE